MQCKLAIDGGPPVRTTPFPPWPFVTKEEKAAVNEVLDSGDINYHRGLKGIEFERVFADLIGTEYALTCNSGTSALHMAVGALRLEPHHEVICPSFTFGASATAVVMAGARPVFADVDDDLPTLSPEAIAREITGNTRAIVAVHLYGHPCRMQEIMALAKKHKLFVIEDCAQCHGARYRRKMTGSIGDINAFSFCQTKIMTTGGEGGMVTTDSAELAGRAAGIREFGRPFEAPQGIARPKAAGGSAFVGHNYRMTEMQSAIGLVLAEKLRGYVEKRRRNARRLSDALRKESSVIRILEERPNTKCSYYAAFAMVALDRLTVDRRRFVDAINAEVAGGGGVAVQEGGYAPIEEFPLIRDLSPDRRYDLPNTRRFREQCMVFEVHPTIEPSDLDDVIEAVRKVEAVYVA